MATTAAALIVCAEGRRDELRALFRSVGWTAEFAGTLQAGLGLLPQRSFDAVLVDVPCSPDEIERLVRATDGISVLVIGAGDGSPNAAELVACGVDDVLERPLSREELARALAKASHVGGADLETPRRATAEDARGLLGDSPPIQHLRELLTRIAPGNATVLIRGESGTGKELVARAIHETSARKGEAFVKVHCAALPETLLESELFGYERGAFTGATSRKLGRVELAQRGTLFLDEIGDISLPTQVKLLRLLQDREFERLGGTDVVHANVRFVTATHRDLDQMVKRGEFREDLFYRLNVVTLWVPPLRARRDDVPLLAKRFCAKFAEANAKVVSLSDEALSELRAKRWPGNVRELQNLVEKLVVLSDGPSIGIDDVRRELNQDKPPFSTQATGRGTSHGSEEPSPIPEEEIPSLSEEVRVAERRALLRALERTRGNRSLAARVLGVSRATLYKKLAEHGID